MYDDFEVGEDVNDRALKSDKWASLHISPRHITRGQGRICHVQPHS